MKPKYIAMETTYGSQLNLDALYRLRHRVSRKRRTGRATFAKSWTLRNCACFSVMIL